MITKRFLAKIGLNTRQKPAFIWSHALACDTAMRVPAVRTTTSPWCGLSMPLFLDFWGASLDPPWLG